MQSDFLEQLVDQFDTNNGNSINNSSLVKRNEDGNINDGYVWIEKGEIKVKNPKGNGRMPSITTCEGILLKVNDRTITDSVFLKEGDQIEVQFLPEEVEGRIEISISEDKLSATLDLKTSFLVEKSLQDKKPETSLELTVDKTFRKKEWPFELEDIVESLKKKDINTNIKYDALEEHFNQGEDVSFLIAQGIPPIKGMDEVVEILFFTEDESDLIFNATQASFRDSSNGVISVPKGHVLAVKHQAQPGKPGITVTGEAISPPPAAKFTLKAGNGVEIIDDGFRAIALIAGQPKMETSGQMYRISVDPLYVHKGNVNLGSGNIRFRGNVKILGNVEDSSLVEATERVNVLGDVDGSRVVAGKHINIREKVIASTILAGGLGAYCGKLLPSLKELIETFDDLSNALKQLTQNAATSGIKLDDKSFGRMIFLLKEKKFTSLDQNIAKFIELVNGTELQLPEVIISMVETLQSSFVGLKCINVSSPAQLKTIYEELLLVYSVSEKLKEKKANIIIDYAQNSKISASGDVIVSGQGCFISTIYSGGNTKINGVFRGGQVYAGGNIFIGELGTEVGTGTRIVVPADKTISLNTVYEDVHIRIGHIRYRFSQQMINVVARLDRGRLVLKGIPIKAEEDREVVPKGLET